MGNLMINPHKQQFSIAILVYQRGTGESITTEFSDAFPQGTAPNSAYQEVVSQSLPLRLPIGRCMYLECMFMNVVPAEIYPLVICTIATENGC